MSKKKRLILPVLLILGLTVVNAVFFLNRNKDGFDYVSNSSYSDLYVHKETPRITNFVFKDDSILVTFQPEKLKSWVVIKDNGSSYSAEGNSFKIPLEIRRSNIRIVSKSLKIDTIRLTLLKKENFEIPNYEGEPEIQIVNSSLPIYQGDVESVEQWRNNYSYVNPNEVLKAKKILANEIGVLESDKDTVKIRKIAAYLIKTLYDQKGIPSNSMLSCTPLQQFEKVFNKESKLYCGNFSHIFSFFANNAGIITRRVNIFCYDINGISINDPHSHNECYIQDCNKWISVDIYYKRIMSFIEKQNPLNAYEFNSLENLKAGHTSFVTEFQNGKFIDTTYYKPFGDAHHYYKRNLQFTYDLPNFYKNHYSTSSLNLNKLASYLIPSENRKSYTDHLKRSNALYYLRFIFLYSQIMVCLFYVFKIFRRKQML